jgi:hypothetical protein
VRVKATADKFMDEPVAHDRVMGSKGHKDWLDEASFNLNEADQVHKMLFDLAYRFSLVSYYLQRVGEIT